jgi:hypothetical protein
VTHTQSLITACASLVLLTFVVGSRMLLVRVREMRRNRISAQSVALSKQRAQRLEDSRASDNFNHLFEVPVLFYALCATAIAAQHIPDWLPPAAWLFVALRVLHSAIQCTYNKVMHRFPVFLAGFILVTAMWAGFAVSVSAR